MVDSAVLHLSLTGLLKLQLLVKREDSALRGLVNVSSSSSAAAEVGGVLWEAIGEQRGWSASCAAIGSLRCLESVSCSSSACVGVLGDVWVRLDNLEVG